MSNIDNRLTNSFARFTDSSGSDSNVVDTYEAVSLIQTAKKIDSEKHNPLGAAVITGITGFTNGFIKGKGATQLEELYRNNPEGFSPLAKTMIEEFVTKGREVDPRLVRGYLKYTSDTDDTPGVVDRKEALELIGFANSINRDNQVLRMLNTPVGSEQLSNLFNNAQPSFRASAQSLLRDFQNGVDITEPVLSWKTSKDTWHCHWFPMKETKPGGGDRYNNLYAPGGVLAKYDEAFGAKSKDYELKHHFRSHDSDESDANWSGHCNNASEVACLLDEPKYPVTYNGVTFSPHQVSGLLVKVSRSLSTNVDFEGRRYNGAFLSDPGDPKPHVFLEKILKGWGSEPEKAIPFVLDIDRKEQVWNYPFDQGELLEVGNPPKGFDLNKLPRDGRVAFYQANLKGTTFDEQAQAYRFWVQYSEDGSARESGWIEGARERNTNPDFAWRPHPVGDLEKRENWVTNRHEQNNPHVKAEDVYEIYIRSTKKDYDSFGSKAGRWFNNLFS
jgi:hypothetical protein